MSQSDMQRSAAVAGEIVGLTQEGQLNAARVLSKDKVQRRSKMDTYCDVLRAIGAGAQRPTHIMYKANLSWNILQSCLNTLQLRGLIQAFEDAESGRSGYTLTNKGYDLLKQYLSIKDSLSVIQ